MSLFALIPARGGSKGIPRKNIRSFNGKPLIQWTIDQAKCIDSISKVVVSTDDEEIASISLSCGAHVPFIRPAEISTDYSTSYDVICHFFDHFPDVSDLLFLQPTSPLKSLGDIKRLLEIFYNNKLDSIVSVSISQKSPALMYSITPESTLKPISTALFTSPRRQDLDNVYFLNGAMYLAKRSFLLDNKGFLSPNTYPFVMPPERSIDIDTELDWFIAQSLMTSPFFNSQGQNP